MSHLIRATIVLAILAAVPASAWAGPSDALKKELQGYVDTYESVNDAQAKEAAVLTAGRLGGRDARKHLADFKDDRAKRVRLGALMGRWFAGARKADDALVEALADDDSLYLTLNDVVGVLPDDKETPLLERVANDAKPAQKRAVFRYLAQQHGSLYELLGDFVIHKDDKLRSLAVDAALFTARDAAAGWAQHLVDKGDDKQLADGVKLAVGLTRRPDGCPKAVDVLESAVDGHSGQPADTAARRLVELENPAGTAYLVGQIEAAEKAAAKQKLAQYLLDNHTQVSAKVAKSLMDAENQTLQSLGWQLAAFDADADMIAKLQKMFRSTKFDERITAVKAMGYTDNDQVVGVLGKALFEGNPTLRRYAAVGLGQIGRPEGLQFLQKALTGERDPDIKIAVVEAVSRIRDDKALQLLRFHTTARDPDVKLAVVRGIRRLGNPSGVNALKVVRNDRNLAVQWQAFMTALELAPEQGLARMARHLRNPPTGFIDDIETLDAATRKKVLRYLIVDGNDASRSLALGTARRIGEPMLGMFRKLAVDSDTPTGVRRSLLKILSDRRADTDLAMFERLARSDAKPIRRLAAWTLTEYGNDALEATFRGLLGSDDPAVRSIAAYGLAVIHD